MSRSKPYIIVLYIFVILVIGRIGWNSISVISVSLINSYFILFSWEQSLKTDQLIVAIRAVKLLKKEILFQNVTSVIWQCS